MEQVAQTGRALRWRIFDQNFAQVLHGLMVPIGFLPGMDFLLMVVVIMIVRGFHRFFQSAD